MFATSFTSMRSLAASWSSQPKSANKQELVANVCSTRSSLNYTKLLRVKWMCVRLLPAVICTAGRSPRLRSTDKQELVVNIRLKACTGWQSSLKT